MWSLNLIKTPKFGWVPCDKVRIEEHICVETRLDFMLKNLLSSLVGIN